MKKRVLYFAEPYKVIVEEEPVNPPAEGEVLVQTLFSAISPGTELIVYRGQATSDVVMDEVDPSLQSRFVFPLKYGCSAVGKVTECGKGVNPSWRGKVVFAFHPHESLFCARPHELVPVPEDVSPVEALLLSSMEAAVSLLMDGQPFIGEQVAVFGQGITGLLTTALLARMPIASLVTLDRFPRRRRTSLDLGAHASLDPLSPGIMDQLLSILQGPRTYHGADLAYEISGNPAALDMAVAAIGFGGRVVVGSWYGRTQATLNLGGSFYCGRIHLISSRASNAAPELSGRWKRKRRFQVAFHWISQMKLGWLITHKFPIDKAVQAYALLDKGPEEYIHMILEY